ncbi:hypothetical protein MtrunA17_Chr4g0071541 [Medicago truncatula]|uniref:Uncharacterized protein n=1 Tax=Medicago truncatula TaxID=3880 RepID=A0A396IK11_MEDTR|nr:hypothetical protein MtrunA17_Chr4g0071541 [Medicago truncatula]
MDLGREEKKREKKIRLEKRKRESPLNIFYFIFKKKTLTKQISIGSVFSLLFCLEKG